MKAGIFHGDEQICSVRETTAVPNGSPRWMETLNFDIAILDIPRSARLCVSLCSVTKNKKKQVCFSYTEISH